MHWWRNASDVSLYTSDFFFALKNFINSIRIVTMFLQILYKLSVFIIPKYAREMQTQV